MPDNRYYYFKDAKGNRHTVNKAAFDNDREGFAKAFPGARMEVIDRKTGRRGDVDVKDAGRVGDFGAHLFTGQTVRREKYQPKTSLGKAAQRVAQEKWGGNEVTKPNYASLSLTKPLVKGGKGASVGLTKPLGNGDKESALVKGLREADALKRRDEEQMPIDYTKPSAVKQMVGRTRREQQTLDRRIEQAGREAGKDVMKPLREKEARLKTPVVDTGDVDINSHIINTQEQADRQLAESGLEFANKHLNDYVSDNILNEFKTATAKGAAAESALSKASPFAYMAAGKAYNEALDPDKLLKHLQEKANADIAKVLSQPKMQEEIGLKAAAYGISPEEYIEKSLIPGLQAKLAADFDKSELSRSMPKSTAEYILRGVNESMLGTIMSMGMTSKKQRQYAQQGMAMTDDGENPDVNPGMAARVARGTLGFVADAPVFGAAGKAGAAVAGKVFGNGVAQTARIANSTLGGRIARMAGSGMVSQGITGVLYGSTNAAVQNYSTGDDTSIGNTVKVMAMGGLSEGASWATMGGIGGAVGAGIYNVSGAKRIPAKAFQLAMEGIGMHMGGNVAKTIEGHDTDWTSIEGNLEACANVVALKLTHARLPKRQSKDGVKESYLDMVARNINGLMTSDGQRAAFGGYTFTNEEKEQLFGSASAPKRTEALYGYDVHDNPLTRKESLTSWAMRAKKTAAKGKGEESYKDTDVEFVKTAYDEIMADNSIPWDTKAKFSALVMGTVPSARPMMEICRIEGNSVNEYSKNGELLSKNSFKSIDERNSIIYSLNMKREDQRLSNAYGAAQIKDEKTAQATLEAIAEANGMTAEQLKAAMGKQPLRRSEEEQNACVALRKAYEDEQFVPGTLHAEQSNTEGKDVVEENGLGTETPNNEAASEVLGDLTKTEDALQAAMDSNDVLKEEYERMQKAGMSNPQIYMELFNSGLTQEQLAPLADYINTLSKAQGMFKGTQDKIVETTQKHVGQWSYKGELNGEKQNGEQMVFVKDDKGRVLIVGAGDVAFDGEGRVRDGDMLTVYDPATREMDFVHAKDVTLEHTTSSEEYAKDYQRQLEELNSTVYAEMQSGGEEGQPSLTEPAEPKEEEGNEASLGLSKPTKPLGEKETTPVDEKETIPVGEEPVATLADGTPVPMMKDSKGRETADYSQMTSEQGAEWMASQFGENAEAAVDGQIKRAEKTMKDAEKIKVDYTGDLNDAKEAEAQKTMAVDAAKKELELYTNIKKAMTEKKVKAGMEKVSSVGGVGEEGSVGSVGGAREKFESGLRVVGNKRTRTLADGSKLRGHYEIVDADSLTPSHNANDGYKKSEGFPVNEEGRTINDRDYENDKQAQLVTDMIAMKYDGQAVDQVPVVTSDGIVVDGNGRTMAGQKAAKNGTDSAYLEALKENAENYGFTAEQIEQSGIKHPRLVLVSDEPMKYDTATFAKFNKNEKKAQGNTQQAVANSKKLSTDEIGTIISEIEGSGSLDAFFNNPSAINSLLTRLVDKGVIGLNEVAGLREGEDKLSAAGKDFVKNLLLGSVFSENTIRMMGADAMLKTKALNGIRAVTDNMKLGDYALMKEIDQAVQLLYEARQGGSGVDAYLRTPAMFGENAADRYDPISQAIALALEGKVEDFRELMMAYNRNAAPYADANQTEMFGERPTKEDFVNEFLKLRNWEDYETRHSSKEGNGDAGSSEGTEPQARGGSVVTSEADYNKAVERLREAKGEERERILDQMGEYVKEFAKSNGYDEPVVLRTKKDLVDAAKNPEEKSFIENMQEGEHYPGYYENGKIHIYLEGSTGSKELRETFIHESVHADNDTDPSRVESLVYSITDMNTLTRRDLESVIEKLVHATHYTDEARKLPEDEALHMLADEALAHLVEYAQRNGIRAISEITNNPTLLNVAEKAFKERENDRRRKEGLDSRGDTEQGKNIDVIPAKKDSGTHVKNTEGESGNIGLGSTDKGSRNNEGQREVDKVEEEREAASVRLQKSDGYSEFADKHGLDVSDVAMYADGMRKGSSAQAARAMAEIGRKIIAAHEDEIHSLRDMRKFRKPVEKALKEAFGDVDRLIDEYRKQVEEERNIMEAARKRAEEEQRKREARLEELAELTDEDIDNRYAEALAKGDEATAREMLDEAARRKGYGDADSDYQGVGAWSAPSKPDYETDEARRNAVGEDSPDLNVEDMAAGYNNQPEDIFVHPNKYSQGLPTSEESGKAIQTAIDDIRNGKKDVKVKVYRAVPTSVKEGKLRNGDWVTPSKRYAEIHGDNRLDGKYRIIEDEVPVSELWWDGNDVNEWGYDNGKSYRYKNVKNSRKLNDLVTRDDKGNVIPPSKRFNQRKADERYQRGVGGVKPSKAEVALRDVVIDRLRENGMDVIADEAEGQRVLDEANGKVREMSFGEAYDYDAYPLGRVEPNLAEKEVAVVEADVNHGFANYKEAKAWAKQHVSKVYNNEESGGKGEVRISNAAIDKFMSQSAIDKSDSKDVHMAVLKVLPEVLKSSIDVEIHPDFLKGEDGKRRAENGMNKDVLVHRCYGAVSIDGKPYRVKITLKENVKTRETTHTHSYEATKIELLAGQHGDVTMTSPRNSNSSKQVEESAGTWENHEGPSPNTNNSISAAKLLENVGMSYNSGEKVLDASKKRSEGVRFFRTANGEAYGFTVGGKIYIDPKIATSETPVHEYAHLWAEALRNGNSKEWQNVVELMKDTKVWDEVKARYPELKSDSEIADEVIATYSGRRGAERLRAEERKITESNSGVYEKIKTIGAFEKVKMSLDKFWKCVADFLHIRYTSAEEVADRVMKDLLDGVDPRGSEKRKVKSEKSNGNPRFQFIGEKGAAEADHAEKVSVRLDNLSVARDMEAEKKDAKAIKMATGWERGADGKWRYEIADMKEFDRNGNLLYRKHHPDYARYIELQDKELKNLFEDGEELTDKEREEYEALSKKYESDKFGGEKLDNIHTLEAYVDAPELFKAYPELRNVRMTFMDTGGDEIASYHHISSVFGVDKDNVGEIVVNTGKVSVNTRTNEVKSAVLHEMQHAIQDMEGFAMGGNTERMKSDFLEAKAEWAARAYAHELEETAKALGEDYDQLGVERALIKEYEDMDMSDELPDKDTRIKGFNYFARGYADRSLDDAIERFRLNESTRGDFNPYIEYSRLAGEVEARNVQKRMDMSAEERRASLAAETEDVAREDQIFLTGDNGVSGMDNRTEKHAADMNGKDNGVMYRIERAAEMYNKAKKLRFKKASNEDSSKELYLSLQNKKGKEYYDTVTELARGMVGESGKAEGVVSEGQSQPRKTSVGRNTERIVGRPKSVVHCAAEIIAADTARSYRNGGLQQSERGLERGEKGALVSREKSSQSEVLSADVWENRVSDPVEREISKRIEDWAKQTNHWFDWRSLRTKYDRTKQLGDGTEAESDVFLSKDGKTVLKVVRSPHALYTSLQGKLNSIALHNKLFGDVGQTIIGITRTTETDALGNDVSTIGLLIEQPFIEGKPVADMFNSYGEEIAYIDKTMTALGFKPEKWADNGGFFNGEPETVWRKGDVIVYDTHGNNIFIDKNGKPRLIDCGIETYKEYAKRHTIYDSAKARETEYENAVRAVKSEIRTLEKEVLNEERIIAMLRDNRREDNADKIDGFINYHEGKIAELKHKIRINAQALQKPSSVHYRAEPDYASLSLSEPLNERIGKAIDKAAEKTGGKVKMVNAVEEIGNEQVRRDIENGKQVTGWYDEKTGEVHLYMPNIHDAYTAEKTVWHETVGHKGMRGLLGDKFKDYMRGLWMDLDNPINAELRAYVKERMSKDSMGFYDAIEEFIAESAEKGKGEPGFWNYIKNKVTDALHEIGYRISPNVKDVKYMLWLAKNVQKKGNDPWWKMRADAVKWKIEHENVEYTKIHGGEFYENDGKNHDFEDMTKEEWDEATDGQIHYRTAPSAATALDRYHSMLNAHGYMATEAFMDNMLSLEKLMKAVDPSIKKIEDVKSSMNPYVLQNTMQGAMSDKMTLFEHQVMKPLDKAMSDVLDSFAGKNTEEKIRECNLYMIGKHGLERNRVLFVRDWFRKMEKTEDVDDAGLDNLDKIWKGERSDLRRKLDSGQIDLREYYRQMDEWIVQNIDKDFKAEEHDYSGMHGLQEIDDLKSPYDDAGAIDSVMSQEAKMESQKKGSVDNLWKRIKDATNYSINSDYENGLMSEELRDRVRDMFDWYVPLRKYDEATAEDIYGYISGEDGKGFIGETLMNAKGRKSLSDVNVLAQIGAMANRAIRNGGQNAVKQAFARFVRNSGVQNLVKETKVWVKKTGTDLNGNDIWEEAYPQIPDNANAHDIATIVDAFETDMKTKQANGEAKTLSNSTDIGFKFARAKNKSEHFVDVKIAGRTHRFVVLGNPRAAQALNGMLENSSPNSYAMKKLKAATRFMAQMATSYAPEFVMRNIIRDAEFASSNVTAKEGTRYGLNWARYYAELNPLNVFYNEGAGALKSLKWKDLKEGVGIGLYARYREGTLGNSKMERYFKEFMQNGGETGWVQVKTMQEWEKEYKRDVSRERSNVAKAGKMLRNFLVGNVENLNEVAENMARFATFCTSRDLGRSAVRSAYDAKQVSTNFNRHGSGDAIKTFKNGEMGAGKEMRRNVYGSIASYLRNYSMFFNAGVQSTHLLMNNVKKAPVGTIASMMAMPFGLGILAAAVNNAMIANEDEKERKGVQDPYGELPEYIRRNNLCIYKGGGEFVTIPLAIELRAFYGLGDLAAGLSVAKNVKSTRNVAMDAVGCMSQLLPVVDFTNSAAFDKEPGKETLKGVLPTAAAPFVEWWLNSDWKGSPIRREGDYTENRPAWMNAYSGTPEKLMDLNKWVNAETNDVAPGNENMRGNSLLDEATDPAMLNHIIGTIGGGAATFVTRGTGLALKYADGREQEIETKDIPFLRSLMYTPSEQTSMARTKAKWYSYKESMEKNMSNYSMLKNKNVPLTERIRNAADRHRFEQGADYARIRIIKDAEKQMKRWNKMKRLNADDKKQVDFANKNIEMIMQKAVEQMDGISDD